MSQHKATEERRYRWELAVVIAIGLAVAIGAIVAILSAGSSRDDLEEFGGLPASSSLN